MGLCTPCLLDHQDKSGLGRKDYVREREAKKKLESKLMEETSVAEFRKKKQAILSSRKLEADLKRSQLACEQLDTEAGIVSPNFPWFWRQSGEGIQNEEEEESDTEEEPPDVSLSCKGVCINL